MIKIYYLDDEALLCDLFLEEFQTTQVKIVTFTEYEKLIKEIKLNPPDLIFLDYRLPGINGDQIALKIGNTIPIYLISGDLNIKTTYKFEGIIQKPYDEEEMRTIIKKTLDFKNK